MNSFKPITVLLLKSKFFMASTLGGGCSIVGRAITSIIKYTGFKSLQGHIYGTNSDGNKGKRGRQWPNYF